MIESIEEAVEYLSNYHLTFRNGHCETEAPNHRSNSL